MNQLPAITARELRETARAICGTHDDSYLHGHPAWRAADRIESLEAETASLGDKLATLDKQVLSGLRALGIGCNSTDQCVAFDREVAGAIGVLEDRRIDAKAAGRALAYRECASAVLNGQESLGNLAMHWKAQAARLEPDE